MSLRTGSLGTLRNAGCRDLTRENEPEAAINQSLDGSWAAKLRRVELTFYLRLWIEPSSKNAHTLTFKVASFQEQHHPFESLSRLNSTAVSGFHVDQQRREQRSHFADEVAECKGEPVATRLGCHKGIRTEAEGAFPFAVPPG